MIDLHCHSTFSDGTYTPEELVVMSRDIGLSALALTDHDSTRGIADFLAANDKYNDELLTCIPGIEISSSVPKGTMHILGYYIDHTDKNLDEQLLPIRDGREYRNKQILEKINKLGCELAWEDILGFAGDDVVGRPHFAMAMIEKGLVNDKQAAFDQYLAKGKPAYADRFRLLPEESIKMIKSAGGVAVLAHPFTLDMGKAALRECVGELRDMGLAGIEVLYPLHPDYRRKEYLSLAKEFDLLVTGGSDFHGDLNKSIRLGSGFGSLHVPDELFDRLKERVGRR
jgi:predicted metal-dependent phosphoesterase TrpH